MLYSTVHYNNGTKLAFIQLVYIGNLPSFLALPSVPLLQWIPACLEDQVYLVLQLLHLLQVVLWLRNHPDLRELPVAQDHCQVQLLPLVLLVQCLREIHLGLVGLEGPPFQALLLLLELHQILGIQALPLDQEVPIGIHNYYESQSWK